MPLARLNDIYRPDLEGIEFGMVDENDIVTGQHHSDADARAAKRH